MTIWNGSDRNDKVFVSNKIIMRISLDIIMRFLGVNNFGGRQFWGENVSSGSRKQLWPIKNEQGDKILSNEYMYFHSFSLTQNSMPRTCTMMYRALFYLIWERVGYDYSLYFLWICFAKICMICMIFYWYIFSTKDFKSTKSVKGQLRMKNTEKLWQN